MHVSNIDEFITVVSELGFEVDSSFDSLQKYTDVSITGYGIYRTISFPVLVSSQDLSPADKYLCYHVIRLLQDISNICKKRSV